MEQSMVSKGLQDSKWYLKDYGTSMVCIRAYENFKKDSDKRNQELETFEKMRKFATPKGLSAMNLNEINAEIRMAQDQEQL